ncbi:MAG: DUF1360 domain-containing protein [Oligoflexus sp.]
MIDTAKEQNLTEDQYSTEKLQAPVVRDNPNYLHSYSKLLFTFSGLFSGILFTAKRFNYDLPDNISTRDLILTSIATHRITLTTSEDRVTRPIRAPFTDKINVPGSDEVEEVPKDGGMIHSMGELLSCPFCQTPWVATLLMGGMVFAPKPTRLFSSIFTISAAADFLHLIYKSTRDKS